MNNQLAIDYEKLMGQKLYVKLRIACAKGDLESFIHVLINQKAQNYFNLNLDELFLEVCSRGQLNIVEFLLTSNQILNNVNVSTRNNGGFRNACVNGHLDIVKYLLNAPQLKRSIDFKASCADAVLYAAGAGQLEILQYFLTSKELKTNQPIHVEQNSVLQAACMNGHVNIIKYLLTSPELLEHFDIHANNDMAFMRAYSANHVELLKFLILEFNIKKTDSIDRALQSKPNEFVIQMFNSRELVKTLNDELTDNPTSETTTKKMKL